jgi:hypothetical protein
LFKRFEAPAAQVSDANKGDWGDWRVGGGPVAFFACCGFCFYDDAEFVECFFGVVFFESWELVAALMRMIAFCVVVTVFDVDVGFIFLLVFIDKVIVNCKSSASAKWSE